jgi:hypothetical protein
MKTALLGLVFIGSQSIETTVSHYKVGDSEASLLKELNLLSYPKFDYPNLPFGDSETVYHLSSGDVFVFTTLTKDNRVILSPAPFFVSDSTSVADRIKRENQAMEVYYRSFPMPVKKQGAK